MGKILCNGVKCIVLMLIIVWIMMLSDNVLAEPNKGTQFSSFDELKQFLKNDSTESHEYIFIKYMCGDFSKDLVFNCSKQNKFMGFVLTSPDKHFISLDNHILCYTYLNNEKIYIEPQTDSIYRYDTLTQKYNSIVHVENGSIGPVQNFINIFLS